MLSNKPYLIRSFYEWIVDSACTPFIVFNTAIPQVKVPQQYIDENGQIILNISPDSVRDFKCSNDFIEFKASFSGIVYFISAPISAVLAIYAQENGEGMFFDFEEIEENVPLREIPLTNSSNEKPPVAQGKKNISHLKLVD